jgi:hypothetical protein
MFSLQDDDQDLIKAAVHPRPCYVLRHYVIVFLAWCAVEYMAFVYLVHKM